MGKTTYKRDSEIFKMSENEIAKSLVEISNDDNYLNDNYNNDDDIVRSQDSIYDNKHNSNNNSQNYMNCGPLCIDDLIVEKMHIHYGSKDKNPVEDLRFFPKTIIDKENFIAYKVKEETYETLLPRVFEELAIRVFYKDSEKEILARQCFEIWCQQYKVHQPFPSQPTPMKYNNSQS